MGDFLAWLAIATMIIFFFVGLVGMTSVMGTPSHPPMDILDDPKIFMAKKKNKLTLFLKKLRL